MNKVPRIILIVVISLFALAIIKDFAIKSVVSLVATQVTGAKVSINWMSVGVLRQSVKISGFKMYNPNGIGNYNDSWKGMPRLAEKEEAK